VLFDIDETMISSDGAGRRAFARVLKETHAISEDIGQISMSGKTDPQILKEIFELADKAHINDDQSLDAFYDNYLTALAEEIKASATYIIHAGIPELLERLHDDKRAFLGLLTGNIERGARMKLDRVQLNAYFPIGAYGSDSGNRLELPAVAVTRANEHFLQAFSRQEVVIVGDSVNDVLCAKHYGAKCIAVNTGKTSLADLQAEHPEYLFANLAETDKVMEAIFS